MGQYFAPVNTDKQEFICPWCLRGGAKLWEWAANPYGGIFVLLLRKSDASGGGDYTSPPPTIVEIDGHSPKDLAAIVMEGVHREGRRLTLDPDDVVGRWAGDRVVLIGDYDSSNLWDDVYRSSEYRNITADLVEAWNRFIEIESHQLEYQPCGSCQDHG